MFQLQVATKSEWLDAVFADFDHFLLDHAACERKAAATGMSFVVKYPDRSALIEPLIAFAREELSHFHEVYRLLAARGLQLAADEEDVYAVKLLRLARSGRDERLLDRLLIAGIIEARGCERFALLTQALTDEPLRQFYEGITRAEARHHGLFFRLAKTCFSEEVVGARAVTLLSAEAEIINQLPYRAALH